MRALALILLLLNHSIWAQIKLDGVRVFIEETETSIEVKATYLTLIDDQVDTLQLKALNFSGSSILQLKVNSFISSIDFGSDFSIVTIPFSGQKPETITLSYQVTPGYKGELPIFFSDWQSSSSDQDFFQLQMKVMEGTSLLFPAETQAEDVGEFMNIKAELPATVSMIRIDDSGTGNARIKRVDQMVIVLFLIIGVLIWFNRKRLIHG
ncbi:MAG: hypothetical protein R8G66_01950 [Cytophagales bacterium]|nr:hypothetical protein [Cytophagales bacterium]